VRETAIAIRACKEVCDAPVIALMSFDVAAGLSDESAGRACYRTMMGVSPADAARALVDAGADGIGANCGTVGPMDIARIVREMAEVADVPLMAEPNAGKPRLSGGRVSYSDISIEEYASGCEEIVRAGAAIIGGCCGTDPDYIEAVVQRLGGRSR